MIIRISDPTVLPGLLRTLEQRPAHVVHQLDDRSVSVSVLGSFADGGDGQLRQFLQAWQKAYPSVVVEVFD